MISKPGENSANAVQSLLGKNVCLVRERIESALLRSGRGGDRVTIVGVAKTFGPDRVMDLIRAGIADIGENRLQEFIAKKPLVTLPCRWHMVGTLQRNKVRKATGQFYLIHSIDSVKLAKTLSRAGEEMGVTTRGLIQVNASGETAKRGFPADGLVEKVCEISELPFIKLEGLMTIGPLTDDKEEIRRAFRTLFELREKIDRHVDPPLFELSMGMSDDFEVAIEEGATMVRLGRVLFGERSGSG